MNKIIVISFLFLSSISFSQSYAPAAGETGSTAISKDSAIIVDWATNVEVQRGYLNSSDTTVMINGSNKVDFGTPSNAVGPATGVSTDAVSLGDGGSAIATFSSPIKNGDGFDFAIFENSFSDDFLELAHVEVSSDGIHYIRFPSHSETQTATQVGGFGSTDPTSIYNLAGKYRGAFGTPFDLEELKDSVGINVSKITHIKLIDVVGDIGTTGSEDSHGNKINDPFPTPFASGGFDLSAIGVINQYVTGLKEFNTDKLAVYPNPSSTEITIEIPQNSTGTVQIIDSKGIVVFSKEQTDDLNNELNIIHQFPSGMYTLIYSTNKEYITEKIVIL